MSLVSPHSQLRRLSPLLIWAVILLMVLAANAVSPGFASPANLLQVLRDASILGIAAAGQTLVILSAGIDLSVGAVMTFSNVLAAQMIAGSNERTLPVMLLVLLLGGLIGLANGAGVVYFRIPAMVMTLGSLSVVRGITLLYSGGAPKGDASPWLGFIGEGRIFGFLPTPVLIWTALAVVVILALRVSVFGRYLLAVGANPTAAYVSGVPTSKVLLGTYTIAGICFALAGFVQTGFTGTGLLSLGNPYLLNTIAAVVLGGTSILGGRGSYGGTIAGAIILVILTSLLTILSIPEAGRQIAQGVVILALLLVYARERRGR